MAHPKAFDHIKAALTPGQVYRRADLAHFTSNVDRYLARLVKEGNLKKLSQGLYAAPKSTPFGEAPPENDSLIKAFLKDDHFVVYSPSQFNSLGLGTTQLYNRLVVFNRKRVGEFTLGDRTYSFYRWREAPKKLTQEFLIIELLNRINELAENREQVLQRLKEKLSEFNPGKLTYAARHYGTLSAQKRLKELLG